MKRNLSLITFILIAFLSFGFTGKSKYKKFCGPAVTIVNSTERGVLGKGATIYGYSVTAPYGSKSESKLIGPGQSYFVAASNLGMHTLSIRVMNPITGKIQVQNGYSGQIIATSPTITSSFFEISANLNDCTNFNFILSN